jgi:hypothetical protein
MGNRTVRRVSIAALVAACSGAMAVDQVIPTGAAAELLTMYPGARMHAEGARVTTFYGMPMTPGATARDAATQWILQHGAAFTGEQPELTETWATTIRQNRFTVLNFNQTIAGIPVEFGDLRVMVLNAPIPRVVYAAGNIAAFPENLNAGHIDAMVATAMAQTAKQGKGLKTWNPPIKVIFQGDGDFVAPKVAWRITAQDADPRTAKCFYIDASNGAVLHVRDDVHYTDITGTVRGFRTQGVHPDASYNPPVEMALPEWVVDTGVSTPLQYSLTDGTFVIPNGGSSAINVRSTGVGHWSNPTPAGGILTQNVTPPGPANFVYNAVPVPTTTAILNAVSVTNDTHTYFKSRAPGFVGLDVAITTRTGVSGTCNAFFQPGDLSINFYNAGGGCVNTAYSTVISHEFGHFIVNRLGRAQNSFGEGYGDAIASLIFDHRATGMGFQTQNVPLRDPIAANIQYPCNASCGGEIHCCGQQLPALWWRIRENLGTLMGSAPGLAETRDTHVSWSLITAGGPNGSNAIGAATAIEVLTVDDNDGNINNGTPHYSQICSAFALGGVQCPALPTVIFSYPTGRPMEITPGLPTPIQVTITNNTATQQPGTGVINYRVNGGSYITAAMSEGAPGQYIAILPAMNCVDNVDYYFGVQTTAALTVTDPGNAPTSSFNTNASLGLPSAVVANLNFEIDPSWTVTNTSVTTGAWERADPHTPVSQGTPAVDGDGSGLCWVTDNRPGLNPNFDLDGGPTVLTTGTYDLSGYALARVQFSRWLTSENGAVDSMTFQYSINNGANWTILEAAPPAASAAGAWVQRTFAVPNPTAQTRFRWSLTDNPSDSVTEAGIDAFLLTGYTCGSACYANCDNSTAAPTLNVSDFTCFLQRYAAGESYANCDNSTAAPTLNVSDFTCFLQSYAAGCP